MNKGKDKRMQPFGHFMIRWGLPPAALSILLLLIFIDLPRGGGDEARWYAFILPVILLPCCIMLLATLAYHALVYPARRKVRLPWWKAILYPPWMGSAELSIDGLDERKGNILNQPLIRWKPWMIWTVLILAWAHLVIRICRVDIIHIDGSESSGIRRSS